RQAIHNTGILRMLSANEGEELGTHLALIDDAVANIGAIEARYEHSRLLQGQPLNDLGARLRVGGGGERNARNAREALVQNRQLQVFRSEVMPPLRHAMRLVDGEERHACLREQ